MLKVKEINLTLSFSWIGDSRPFSRGVSGGMRASEAYTPTWLAGQKQKVSKKKKAKKAKKKVTKKKKRS